MNVVARAHLDPVHIICRCRAETKKGKILRVRCWEAIADKLSKTGWSLGWVSAVDSEGRTAWIVDAHRDNGKRLVVRADEKVTVLLELESAISACIDFA